MDAPLDEPERLMEWICVLFAFAASFAVTVAALERRRALTIISRLQRERDALLDVLREDFNVTVTFLDQPPIDGEREHWAPDSDAVH